MSKVAFEVQEIAYQQFNLRHFNKRKDSRNLLCLISNDSDIFSLKFKRSKYYSDSCLLASNRWKLIQGLWTIVWTIGYCPVRGRTNCKRILTKQNAFHFFKKLFIISWGWTRNLLKKGKWTGPKNCTKGAQALKVAQFRVQYQKVVQDFGRC